MRSGVEWSAALQIRWDVTAACIDAYPLPETGWWYHPSNPEWRLHQP